MAVSVFSDIRRRLGAWLLCGVAAWAFSANAETITYNPEQVKEKEELISSLLRLALSHSDPSLQVAAFHERLPGSRAEQYIMDGKLSVWWAGASQERESKLKPIYLPVLKGLVGHRLFIIRHDAQSKFDNVYTLTDLKRLKAGQGRTWGDAMVLKASDIPMETATKTANLFYMLEGGRFDYFPRSAHEPWAEVQSYAGLDLTVESKLVLIYPQPMYFYVSANNNELYEKIRTGMEMALADGSYDELFYNHPMVKNVVQISDLKNRRVIRIPNPLLTAKAPLDRPELWLDLSKL